MLDVEKTQHFSKNKDLLFNIKFNPANAVDPFAGDCDMQNYFPNTKWEFYDIDPKKSNVILRDSLLNPIDYADKTVITNPPYLSKNKTKDFREIYDKYNVDDLYKAAIKSIVGCKNGILIIPINFFTDEKTKKIRTEFLSNYKVSYVNYFTRQMFENTSYNVCSFYFEKGKTNAVEFYDFEQKASINIELKEEFGYRVGGDFFNQFENIKPVFSKSLNGKANTNLFLNCLDKRKENFSLHYTPNYIYNGKKEDRMFATLNCEKDLTIREQVELANKFNTLITKVKKQYGNLIFSNYRDFGRKRISLDDAYKICTFLLS